MKIFFLPLLCAFLCFSNVQAQKVGLVLSGGGAKGLTHIGIIKALEENNIPIDYIAGTSMGAIIGSLYAMGYSPDEMKTLIKSPDFKRWYSGQMEESYIYYFKKNLPTPELFNIHFSLDNPKTQILPTSMVNPIQMNLAFIDLFARATAASGGDFNKLFVPFRCVASDVYNKKQIIFSKGDLGDAVRASMSFPFVFKPIKIDSVLAYDGGIYNNFPTDVMRNDFHPDIIIGSVVSKNPTKPDENDLMSQIENMVMQKTNYSLPDSAGIVMTFKYEDINLLDFQKIDELEKIGYDRTMTLMDSIKGRIHRRINYDNIRLRRLVYKSNYPELRFKRIYISGANSQQEIYIKKELHDADDKIFSYEELKKGYFRLLSGGDLISEIIPHAVFNKEDETYDLYLKVKMENNFSLHVGGDVSTTNSNQIYLGLSYRDLNYYSKEVTLDGQIGRTYSNLQLMGRVDLPTTMPTSYRLIASISTFDYFQGDNVFSNKYKPAFNSKDERFIKLMAALPFLSSKRAEFSIGMARFKDKYFQSNIIDFDNDKNDRSVYNLYGGSISFNGSTLNDRQYATQGYSEALIAQIYTGKEYFYPGVISDSKQKSEKNQAWLQLSYNRERYHSLSSKFTLGWCVQGLFSSKNFSENYTATLLQAGEFSPTPHSRLTYNEAFRANQFVAGGIKPIFHLSDIFHIRSEFYGFLPIFPIKENALNKAYYGKSFTGFEYLGQVSVVCKLPFGSISAYVNHYSSPSKDWNVGLTIGWQLFNYRFIE